jgi:hypothetical protein
MYTKSNPKVLFLAIYDGTCLYTQLRLGQEDQEFQASLGYTARSCLKKKQQKFYFYKYTLSFIYKYISQKFLNLKTGKNPVVQQEELIKLFPYFVLLRITFKIMFLDGVVVHVYNPLGVRGLSLKWRSEEELEMHTTEKNQV